MTNPRSHVPNPRSHVPNLQSRDISVRAQGTTGSREGGGRSAQDSAWKDGGDKQGRSSREEVGRDNLDCRAER